MQYSISKIVILFVLQECNNAIQIGFEMKEHCKDNDILLGATHVGSKFFPFSVKIVTPSSMIMSPT